MRNVTLFPTRAAMLLAGLVVLLPAGVSHAATLPQAELQALSSITKTQAIAIALKAVGGGKVISAIVETEDRNTHWTIDIVGARYEYEVWVSLSGSVVKIIAQPN